MGDNDSFRERGQSNVSTNQKAQKKHFKRMEDGGDKKGSPGGVEVEADVAQLAGHAPECQLVLKHAVLLRADGVVPLPVVDVDVEPQVPHALHASAAEECFPYACC